MAGKFTARKLTLIGLMLVMLFSLISCGDGDNKEVILEETSIQTASPSIEATNEPTASPSPTPQPAAANGFKLPVEGLRPIAVMIDNEGTKSMPQGSLDKAQIIYEIIVEGGETRLMPVFWGVEPEMIGSVRSSRHYFLDYSMENDAIYVHFGWSYIAERDIKKLKLNNINGVANGGEIFWDLTKDRNNWQDSYTSMEKIQDYIKRVKYRTTTDKKQVFSYNQSVVEPASGNKAEKVKIVYSSSYTCGFEYDQQSKTYLRFRKGKPQIERTTEAQLAAENIIIQFVKNHTIKGDTAGRQEVYTVGSGSGYYITKGKAIKIKWSKSDRSAPTRYLDESGNAIKLNPGQTWVQITPTTGKVTLE
ncbi:MAG: hypothetical protein A2Y21_01065 [Clostridiales bacterium GWC2_40_7]|nr:MAG: hypothetical protein A2Y21_01065 [Clostridiales bacterium GWC2_40_7]